MHRWLVPILVLIFLANGAALFWPLAPSQPAPAPQQVPIIERHFVERLPESTDLHPLFQPKPRIIAHDQESMPAPAAVEQAMPHLVGLVVRGQKVRAIFSIPGDGVMRIAHEGDIVSGWIIERIASRSVYLLQKDHRVVLPLDPEVPQK